MKRSRNHYDSSYKTMAIELAEAKGSIPATAKELGIPQDLIRRWMREKRSKGSASFSSSVACPPTGHSVCINLYKVQKIISGSLLTFMKLE
jgi:transposase-like protein